MNTMMYVHFALNERGNDGLNKVASKTKLFV